jgi:hypothetical protein
MKGRKTIKSGDKFQHMISDSLLQIGQACKLWTAVLLAVELAAIHGQQLSLQDSAESQWAVDN